MKNQNNGWKDATIVDAQTKEPVSKSLKRLEKGWEHKVDRKEILGWALSIWAICTGSTYFVTATKSNADLRQLEMQSEQITIQSEQIKIQSQQLDKQSQQLEKHSDLITNLRLDVKGLTK